MKLDVRFFASLADRAGASVASVEVEDSATVRDLWELLVARHPDLGAIGYRPMVACDASYAGWDTPLRGVGEVAFLPPVSGG